MYRLVIFMHKRDTLSHSAFKDYYEDKHVPLVLSLSKATRPSVYTRKYMDPTELTGNLKMAAL